ncbi:MAG TPA: hypothetical protein H9867_03500 [Candidatus Corynebacterium gallistercoris]|uniref:Uncharacterized protein n=1 Tax=Candidatus Corynebacterium gallistercoris TaxID=2838530 RepID=A0A9D1RXG7_9CORY|nr:hypothetical protein [Candidatus Corynebacterium gallistercoris]
MPVIIFRILAEPSQREQIVEDFTAMMNALDGALDASLSVDAPVVPDPELVTTWVELFGEETEEAEGAVLAVDVARYDLGSISGLTMNFAELLTTREKDPAEPLLRQVKDDQGTPRVPWHVEVRP